MCPKFCTDAKPYKHTQTLTLRKAREIVRFWKGWWSDNPSGSRPNFFGRQHLTFDKGGKCDGAGRGNGCAFEKVVEMEIVDATGGASKASDKCSFAKVVEMERVGATGGASCIV